MKRGLVLALTALALVAGNSAVQAQSNVQLSLNLRYTDPAAPAEGGRWFLVGKTDSAFGLAGVSVRLNNVDTTGIALGNPTAVGSGVAAYATMASTVTNSIANAGNPYNGLIGGSVNVVWGQDVSTSVVANIGKGAGTAGNLTNDPLRNPAWANAALLVSGTFGATRPTFVGAEANVLGAATAGTAAALANVTTTVRGDSVRTLGLEKPLGTPNAGLIPVDANRDGLVNVAGDGFAVSANLGLPNRTWDQGDFNNSGTVTVSPDGFTLSANLGGTQVPPAVGAVPEPATVSLAAAGLLGMVSMLRRRNA